MARGVGMRETCREHALAHSPAHAPAHARRTLWHTLRRKLWHALRHKQLGRLGGGLPAVLGRVFLCCRQPALKVSQLALEVLLLALKVLYERLKVWGRVFVGVQTLTLLLQPLTHDVTPWQTPQHTNWTLTNFVPPAEPREHEAHVQMFGPEEE